MADDSGGRAV